MPIQITCPKCHKRFRVSDKFAGQKGPCPNCKTEITVPTKEEEVVVHAPEHSGPTDSAGTAVLKPLERSDASFSIFTAVVYAVLAIVAVVVAFSFRVADGETAPLALMVAGAFLVAIPVVRSGYGFLRDDELEPYYGRDLWMRTLICSLVYALLWGIYGFVVQGYVFSDVEMEMYHVGVAVILMVAGGAFGAYVCLDLETFNAVVHFGMYLLITLILKYILNVPAF